MSKPLPIALMLLAAGCAAPKPANLAQVCSAPPADPAALADVESGNAAFAVALLQTFGDGGGNLVLSPYSVSTALDLAYAGAGTTTATQLADVLGLGSAAASPGPAVAAVACAAETAGSSDGNQLSIATALFGQRSFTFVPAFLATRKTTSGAPLQPVDFAAAPAAALATVNAWVSTETQAMIPSLLGPGDVDASTVLVLVNALYFKGVWQSGFDPGKTETQPFTRADGSKVSVPLMTQGGPATFGYFKGAGFAIAELPYQGGKVALDVILPDQPNGLAALVTGLSSAQLKDWFGQVAPTGLAPLQLPRFKLDTHVELAQPLQALGLTLPFDAAQADFSGMDGAHDLYLQAVVHEAVIDVDETGTTAAAATAVSVATGLSATTTTPSFIADHPFLFALRDLGTGTLLFLGEVADPTQP